MKLNYKDDFDALAIRHDYMKRLEKQNTEYLTVFSSVIKRTAYLLYKKHYHQYSNVGFDLDDINSFSSIYAFYYSNLYSSGDIESKKERNNLISFIRQRLGYLSVLCERKGRNIVGRGEKVSYVMFDEETNKNKKVNKVKVKEMKKEKSEELNNVIEVKTKACYINSDEYLLFLDNQNNMETKDIEAVFIEREDYFENQNSIHDFNEMPDDRKKKVLQKFVRNNVTNSNLREEISIAKKMIKTLAS